MNPLTAKLNNGATVLAKLYEGEPYAKTYANRTGAEKAATAAGEGWAVCSFMGRPFYVAKLGADGNPILEARAA